MAKKAIVIGAGIGGLATALRLKKLGLDVSIYDKNLLPGGKANQIFIDGFRFDTGPSLFTMPFVLENLFKDIELNINDYLEYEKLEILCKYFYADGTIINAYSERNKFIEEMTNKTNDTKESINKYFGYTNNIYKLTHKIFLENSLHQVNTYLTKDALTSLINLPKIDTNRSMAKANSSFFKDYKTLQIFNRYATYNGSNPFKAPATLNIIAHVENNLGGYFIKGGMYNLVTALYKIAKQKNINFYNGVQVEQIKIKDKKVIGIVTKNNGFNEFVEADIVVSNSDIFNTYNNLLSVKDKPKIEKYNNAQLSTSALVFYWGIKGTYDILNLHNIIFSEDYEKEFEELFNKNIIPNNPTIYIYISSKLSTSDAPKGHENWFVMINVPSRTDLDWNTEIKKAKQIIIDSLNKRLGINLNDKIISEKTLTPLDIENLTLSYKGSLYGMASNNKFSAFLREQNRSKKYKGLYFVGGSVHPGGGIPLVLLSAKITSNLIKKYEL